MKSPYIKKGYFPECPRCVEELAEGIVSIIDTTIKVFKYGYRCSKHGRILLKDMKPNEFTRKRYNIKLDLIALFFLTANFGLKPTIETAEVLISAFGG